MHISMISIAAFIIRIAIEGIIRNEAICWNHTNNHNNMLAKQEQTQNQ